MRGLAMLEVLISMLLIALWMASSAGMQAAMIRLQKGADLRQRGVTLAADLAERMQANPVAARAGSYALAALPAPVAATDCSGQACSPDQLAAWDLTQWSGSLNAALPIDSVSVTVDSSSGLTSYTIRISWRELRGRQSYGSTATTEVARVVTSKVIG
jgi:type IV pilus assembly protein PilV